MKETPARIRNPRAAKYLPLVAVVLLPLLVELGFARSPAQSGLAGLELQRSPLKRGRASQIGLHLRLERPLTRRLLLIVLDAWRREVALDDERMPRLAALALRGSRGTVLAGVRTLTKPCVRTLMTGRNADLRDTALNLLRDPVSEESLVSRLNAAGSSYTLIDATPAFSGLFEQQCRVGSLLEPSVQGQAWDPADPAHDSRVEASAMHVLEDPRQTFIMIHLESEDLAGHIYGPKTAGYERVLRATDDRIARLASRLDFQLDTLIVIGDHGTDDLGHHGGPERQARETAYLAVGSGIRHGNVPLDPLDVADSLALLLGLCPPLDSSGAPNPEFLAINPRELKLRCDRCLLERLETFPLPTSQWLSTTEARKYFKAEMFSPAVADLYRQVASPLPEDKRSWSGVAMGIATMAVSVLTLMFYRIESRLRHAYIAGIFLLAVLPGRDTVAVFLFAVLLVLASVRDRGLRRLTGCAVAVTLLAFPFLASTLFPDKTATRLGFAGLVLGGLLFARSALRSRSGKAVALAVTTIVASAAAALVPGTQIPELFSPSTVLIDFALATGILFLIVGLVLKEDVMVGLASLALAGCLFHGWPLLIFVLLEVLLLSRAASLVTPRFPWIVWAPAAALAILRTVNGGYGLSKIDLSLSIVGRQGDSVNYAWAAAMILLAYLLPLLLSVRVAMKMTGKDAAHNLSALLSSLLIFSGADLVFVAAPRLDWFGRGRYEEIFSFDIVLSVLVCMLYALTTVWSLIGTKRDAVGTPASTMASWAPAED
jgi:hypothetical protein